MRAALPLLLVACADPDPAPVITVTVQACGPVDAGVTVDGGATVSIEIMQCPDPPAGQDAGFRCSPGAVFCSGRYAWRCTFTGTDAELFDDCAANVDGGYCAASCPPGHEESTGATFSCCSL